MATKPRQVPGAAQSASAQATEAAEAVESASLPNAVDVDARFLKGPALTRQGWVVPDEAWQKANRAEFEAALKAQD